MSQSSPSCYIVTFRYQEQGLTDLAKLTGQLTREGFTTSISDENGTPHELGSNSFSLITIMNQQDIQQLAQGLAQVALGKTPEVTVTHYSDYIKQLHTDT